jgi:hypothetical protein
LELALCFTSMTDRGDGLLVDLSPASWWLGLVISACGYLATKTHA